MTVDEGPKLSPLEAAMETYRKAAQRLSREATALDASHRPLTARFRRHQAHIAKRAAVAEIVNEPPKDLLPEVTE